MKFTLALTAFFATAVIAAPLNAKRGDSGSSSPSSWGSSAAESVEEIIQAVGSPFGNSASGIGSPSANGNGNPSASANGNSATGNSAGDGSANGNSAGDGSANDNGSNSANGNQIGNVGGIDIDPSIALSPSIAI